MELKKREQLKLPFCPKCLCGFRRLGRINSIAATNHGLVIEHFWWNPTVSAIDRSEGREEEAETQ